MLLVTPPELGLSEGGVLITLLLGLLAKPESELRAEEEQQSVGVQASERLVQSVKRR